MRSRISRSLACSFWLVSAYATAVAHDGFRKREPAEFLGKLAPAVVKGVIQPLGGKNLGERLGAETCKNTGGVVHQPDATKFAGIIEDQGGIPGQLEDQAVMRGRLVAAKDHQQVPAHAQVNDQVEGGKADIEELGPAGDLGNLLTRHLTTKLHRGGFCQSPRPAQIG